MDVIGTGNYHYRTKCRIIVTSPNGGGQTILHMNQNKTVRAATPAIIALAAILLFVRFPISPDAIAGVATLIFVSAVVALEYGLNWKRLFGR